MQGNLDVTWYAGWPAANRDPHPPIQVHHYAPDTVILRQNKSVHFEAPFLFLLFGADRAVLIDTGATPDPEFFPLRHTVDTLIQRWLADHPRDRYPLLVVHSHAHGDHIAGDGQFADRPDTTVVGHTTEEVIAFHGLTDWPAGQAELDLGGRVLDVLPGPGHEPSAVVFYDRHTGLLFTGDTFLRGRLYIVDLPAYVATIDRLLVFCAENPVSHILGCHIEMTTTSGRDYPIGAGYQPDEPPLQLTVDHLRALRTALDEVGEQTGIHVFDDFVIHWYEVRDHRQGSSPAT